MSERKDSRELDPPPPPADDYIAPAPRVSVQAFCETETTAEAMQSAGLDRRLAKAHLTIKMGGMEAARILKQRMPEVPIVLFTLYSTGACGEDSRIDAVVSKPEGLGRLRECVDRLLAPR